MTSFTLECSAAAAMAPVVVRAVVRFARVGPVNEVDEMFLVRSRGTRRQLDGNVGFDDVRERSGGLAREVVRVRGGVVADNDAAGHAAHGVPERVLHRRVPKRTNTPMIDDYARPIRFAGIRIDQLGSTWFVQTSVVVASFALLLAKSSSMHSYVAISKLARFAMTACASESFSMKSAWSFVFARAIPPFRAPDFVCRFGATVCRFEATVCRFEATQPCLARR